MVQCPCCGYDTLKRRGFFEICILCWWEDDGTDEKRLKNIPRRANKGYSLSEAKENFRKYLVKYRPSDTRFSKQTQKKIVDAKRKIIAIYEELDSQESESSREKLRVAKGELRRKLLEDN